MRVTSFLQTPVGAVLLLAAVSAIYLGLNPAIIADWRGFSFDDGSYSHAYLIPFIFAYLVWDAHARREITTAAHPLFLPLLILALYALFVAQAAQFSFMERVLTPLPLLFAFLCVFRFRFSLLIPVLLLWFITPIWGVLTVPLQESSARAVESAMRLTQIPTFVDGNFVQIPAGVFEIAEGCSGLRYVISALAIALVYCHLYLRSKRSMLMFTLMAVVGAILTNWLRILLLVLIGHFSDMKSEIIRDHNMFGWYLFIPLMLLLARFGRRLESASWETGRASQPLSAAINEKLGVTLPLVLLILAGFSGFVIDGVRAGAFQFLREPVRVDAMSPTLGRDTQIEPVLYGDFKHDALAPSVSSAGSPVHVYRFDGVGPVNKPDFYLNSLVPRGWKTCAKATQQTGVRRLQLCRGPQRALLDVLYAVEGSYTSDPGRLKFLRLRQGLKLQSGSTLYWWFMPCTDSPCEAPALGGLSLTGRG